MAYVLKDNKCLEKTGVMFTCRKSLEFNSDYGNVDFDITDDIKRNIGNDFDINRLEVIGVSVESVRMGTKRLFDVTDHNYISVFSNDKNLVYLGVGAETFVGMGSHNIIITFCYFNNV